MLVGINGSYVDDPLQAGYGIFRDQVAIIQDRIKVTGYEKTPFDFAGYTIIHINDQIHANNQTEYLKNLEIIDEN